jgi:hypothetical protein
VQPDVYYRNLVIACLHAKHSLLGRLRGAPIPIGPSPLLGRPTYKAKSVPHTTEITITQKSHSPPIDVN